MCITYIKASSLIFKLTSEWLVASVHKICLINGIAGSNAEASAGTTGGMRQAWEKGKTGLGLMHAHQWGET